MNQASPRGRQLPFPLNVYATLLELEFGRADHLHFGLFEGEGDDILTAQARSTRLILDRLPTQPARILEVGIGFGTTLGRLRELGHRVTGITPDPAQIAEARERLGEGVELIECRFEELPAERGPFDLLLFQESAQYLEPRALFAGARRLLAEGGRVLLLDEAALRPHRPGLPALPPAEELIAQAARHDFTLEERLDLGRQAAPTVEYLLEALARRGDELLARLTIDAGQMSGLLEALRGYRDAYARGDIGYLLLNLRRNDRP